MLDLLIEFLKVGINLGSNLILLLILIAELINLNIIYYPIKISYLTNNLFII